MSDIYYLPISILLKIEQSPAVVEEDEETGEGGCDGSPVMEEFQQDTMGKLGFDPKLGHLCGAAVGAGT